MKSQPFTWVMVSLAVLFLCGLCLLAVFGVLLWKPQGSQPLLEALPQEVRAPLVPPTATPTPSLTPTSTPTATPTQTPTPTPAVLVGAGDISICGGEGDDITADLLENIPGEIFTAGDNSNENGTLQQYRKCFQPSWGRFKERLHPAPGNHDFSNNENGYFKYFGAAAGPDPQGYYSFDVGAWHIIVLNSNCPQGCGYGSEQETWLRKDLASHPAACTLAIWHHPRFTSGHGENTLRVGSFWEALYKAGAEIVINGHDHHYERFAPQNPQGEVDLQRGIRQFIVGTGGAYYIGISQRAENSEKVIEGSYGVLKLTLYEDRYDWEFIPEPEKRGRDSGSGTCH